MRSHHVRRLLVRRSGIDVDNSGSTAALVHCHGAQLTAAWVRRGVAHAAHGRLGRAGGSPHARGARTSPCAAAKLPPHRLIRLSQPPEFTPVSAPA
jgi:hypothetical protein